VDPVIAVSWGELLDRISILEIKQVRLSSDKARELAVKQLAGLRKAEETLSRRPPALIELRGKLRSVNERLWTIEDEIRAHEARKDFDARFVELARSVYLNNDERSRLKHAIDQLLGSQSEPKAYSPYTEHKRDAGQ
jgi:predicted  nucleic acid-binding Zn-ribbon protein